MPAPSRSPRVVYSASPADREAAETSLQFGPVGSSAVKTRTPAAMRGGRRVVRLLPTLPFSRPVCAPADPWSPGISPRWSSSSFTSIAAPPEGARPDEPRSSRPGRSGSRARPAVAAPAQPVHAGAPLPPPGQPQDRPSSPGSWHASPVADFSPLNTPLAESRASSTPGETRPSPDGSRQFQYQPVQANAPDPFARVRRSNSSLSSLEDGRSVGSALTRKSDKTTATVHDPPADDDGFHRIFSSEGPPSTSNGSNTSSRRDTGAAGSGDAVSASARRREDPTTGPIGQVASDGEAGAAERAGSSLLGRLPGTSEKGDGNRSSSLPSRRLRSGERAGGREGSPRDRHDAPVESFLGGAPAAHPAKKRREGGGTEETLPGGENLLTDGDDSSSPSAAPSDKQAKAGDNGGFRSYGWLPTYFRKSRKRRLVLLLLVLLLLLLAIGLPVLFCLVAPRIVAEQVRASKVRVLSTSIENPDPSGFLATIVFEFLSSSPVTAHVDDLPLDISWRDQPVGRMTVPRFTLEPSTRHVAFSADFRVTDLANWNAFVMAMLREGKSEWRIAGSAEIHALGLTFRNIPFDKTVAIDGPPLPVAASQRQVARGFRVAEMDLTSSDAERLRVRATVVFDNTSTSSINSLGEIQFLMFFKDTPIGLLRSRGPVLLRRGINTYVFDAELHPAVLPIAREIGLRLGGSPETHAATLAKQSGLDAVDRFYDTRSSEHAPSPEEVARFRSALSEMMSASLSGSAVHVKTVGVFTTQPLFAAAVRALAVETPVDNLFGDDGGAPRGRSVETSGRNGLVKEMRFDHFDISAESQVENRARVAAKVTVRFVNPLGHNSPLEIRKVSLSASLRRGGLQGTPMGVINGLMRATGPPRRVDRPEIPLNREEGSSSAETSDGVWESQEARPEERADVAAVEREEKLVNYPEAVRAEEEEPGARTFLARSDTYSRRAPAESSPDEGAAPRALSASREKPVLVNSSVMDVSFEMEGTIDLEDDGVPFSAFIREMVSEPSPFVVLAFTESDVEIQAMTAVGPLSLTKLPLDQTLQMASMGDMRNVEIESFEVTGEVPGAWLISTVVIFPSKAPTSVYLGDLGLNLSFRGVSIGSVVARNVHIAQGANKLTFTGRLQPPHDATETLSEFFSSAISSPARNASNAAESLGPNDALGRTTTRPESAGVPVMEVVVTATARRLLDSLEAAEQERRGEGDAEAGSDSGANRARKPLKWVQEGLEGVTMEVPVPQVGTTADLVRSVNLAGLRMSLDAEEGSRSLDEAVPMRGYIELFLNNPLGRHLPLRLSAVSLSVALVVALPSEASWVPTPSGLYRPVVAAGGAGRQGEEAETVGSESPSSGRVATSNAPHKTRRMTVGRLSTELRDLRSEAVGHLFSEGAEGRPSLSASPSASGVDASVLRLLLPLEVPLELAGDGTAFAEFVGAFLEREQVEVFVTGQAECTVQTGFGDVKIRNVDLESAMPLEGLNGLKGSKLRKFQVLGFGPLRPFLLGETETAETGETAEAPSRRPGLRDDMRLESEEKGLLLAVSVQMRNPSEATVDMGSIELEILHLGTAVGRMRGTHISLVPGENFLDLVGGIILNRETERAVSSLVSRALLNRDLELSVAVADSTRNAPHSRVPRWFVRAMRGAKILPVIPPLAELLPGMDGRTLLQDISFDALTVSAAPSHPDFASPSLRFHASTTVLATNPLGQSVPVLIQAVSLSATVLDLQGRPIGHLELPETPATSAPHAAPGSASLDVFVKFEDARLFLERDGVELGRTIQEYLRNPSEALGLLFNGHATVSVLVGDAATLEIRGVQIEKEVFLGNRAQTGEEKDAARPSSAVHEDLGVFAPRLESFSFEGVHPEGGARLFAVASMQNPASVRLLLPRLFFNISFNDSLLGQAWIADDVVTVEPFPLRTSLHVRGRLYRQTTAHGLKALNDLVKAVVSQVTIGDDSEADPGQDASTLAPKKDEDSAGAPSARVKIHVNTGDGRGLVSSPSFFSSSETLPTWIAVGLDGLELEAPVDGRQLLPVDMLRRLVLKEILVRVQPGLAAPLLLDSFLHLRLQNPFGTDALLEVEDLSIRADLRDARSNRVFGRLTSSAESRGDSPETHARDMAEASAPASPSSAARHVCVPETQSVSSLQASEGTPTAASASSETGGVCTLELPFAGALAITDAAAFADFATAKETPETPLSASAVIRVEGDAGVTVHTPLGRLVVDAMALRQNVPFSGMRPVLDSLTAGVLMQAFQVKQVILDGADGLDRIVFSARVLLGAQPHAAPAARGDASRESTDSEALEVHAGDLKLNLISQGQVIGTVATKDAVIGGLGGAGKRQEITVEGELFEASKVRGTPDSRLLSLMQSAVGEANVDLLIQSHRGEQTAARPAWLLDTIDRMQLRPALSGLDSVLRLVEGMRLRSLSIAILDSTRLATDAIVSVDTRSPLGPDVELRIDEVAAEIRLFSPLSNWKDASVESPHAASEARGRPLAAPGPMATLRLASRVPVSQVQEGDLLRVELLLNHVKFGDTLELAGDGALFAEFVAGLVNGEVAAMPYEATVHASVSTAFGNFGISGFKVRAAVDSRQLAGAAQRAETAEAGREPEHSADGGDANRTGDGAGATPRGLLEDFTFDLLDVKFRGKGELPTLDSGAAFDATMALRLPLDLSLSLGSLAFRVEVPRTPNFEKPEKAGRASAPVESAYLGTLSIPNLTIRPGTSTIAVSGHLDPRPTDLEVVSEFLSRAVRGLSPYVLVLGEGVELSGAETPLWLVETARAMRIWAPMPASGLDKFVAGSFVNIALRNVGISAIAPAVQGRDDAVALSADVRAKILSPFGEGSRLVVKAVDLQVDLKRRREDGETFRRGAENAERERLQDGTEAGTGDAATGTEPEGREPSTDVSNPVRRLQDSSDETVASPSTRPSLVAREASAQALETVGRLRLRDMPLQQVGDEVHIHLEDVVLEFEDRGDAFAALALSLMESASALTVYVRGAATVAVDTDLGFLTLREVPLALEVPMDGLEIFGGRTLEHLSEGALENLRVTDFEDENVPGFHLSTRLVMENNHDVSVDLGPMAFDLTYEGTVIGAVVLPHFAMLPGRNEVRLEGAVKPEGLDAFSELATAFFLESQYTIGVRGAPTKRLFSASAGEASEAARLAIARAGVQGRAPRWLREVLANVDFSVPISSLRSAGQSEARGRSAEEAVTEMVKKVELVNIDVDFSGPRDPFISGEVQVLYALPDKFNIRHQIETVWSKMTIFHHHGDGDPTPLGSMDLVDLAPAALPAARPASLAEPEASALVARADAVVPAWETEEEKERGDPVELRFFVDMLRLSVREGAETAMADMLAEIVNKSGDLHILLKGHARLRIKTAVGPLLIGDVPINLKKSLKCIGGLDPETVKNAFQMEDFGIQAGKAHGLLASANLRLMMPKAVENFTVRLGKVTLDMFTPISQAKQEQLGDFKTLSPPALKLVQPHPQFGYVIQAGMVQVADMSVPSSRPPRPGSLTPGAESAVSEGDVDGGKHAASDGWLIGKAVLLRPVVDVAGEEIAIGTRDIMSNYMNGRTSKLVIRGSADSSTNPVLANFFAKMEVVVDLPGTTQQLIKGIQISFRNGSDKVNAVSSFLENINDPQILLQALPDFTGSSRLRGLPSLNFFVPVIEAVSIYENPVRVPIKLFYADMETFYEGQSLGGMVIDKNDKPDVIPPMQVSHSTPVRIVPKLQNTSAALAIVRNIISGSRRNVAIDAKGEVRIGIQDFRIGLDVDMEGIQVAF